MKTVTIREIDNGWLCEWEFDQNSGDYTLRKGAQAFRSYEELESWLGEFLLAKAVKVPGYTNVINPRPLQNAVPELLPTQNYKP